MTVEQELDAGAEWAADTLIGDAERVMAVQHGTAHAVPIIRRGDRVKTAEDLRFMKPRRGTP
jgi:hypothetical protein